jgi:hypothetical protein
MNRREFLKTIPLVGTALALTVTITGCSNSDEESVEKKAFLQLAEQYVDEFYQFHPIRGPESGKHQYDDRGLDDLSPEAITRELESLKGWARRLAQIDTDLLTTELSVDYSLLANNIAARQDELEITRTYAHNPYFYTDIISIGILFQMLFEYAHTTRSTRLQVVFKQLDSIPALMENAILHLQSVSQEALDYGILSLEDLESYLKGDVRSYFADAQLPDVNPATTTLDQKIDAAWASISKLITHLRTLRDSPSPKPSFALGAEGLAKRWRLKEGIYLPIEKPFDKILTRLLAYIESDRAELVSIAGEIDPNKDVLSILLETKKHHPNPGEVERVIQGQVDKIVEFIQKENIIAIPDDERIVVKTAPAFMLWWYATAWSTGPFEPQPAPPSVYYVSDPKGILSDEEANEFLEEMSKPVMWSTSSHEAYPGHFLQGYALKQVKRQQVDPGNLSIVAISNVFYPYSFGEGWAVYCEQMMREEGLLDDAGSNANVEYRLCQLADSLLGRVKTYAGIRMHLGEMNMDEAVDFIERNGLVNRIIAYNGAQRLAYEPDAILYGIGRMALVQLREDYEEAVQVKGRSFTLREYHDHLLSLGQYPIPVLRKKMLPDDKQELIR